MSEENQLDLQENLTGDALLGRMIHQLVKEHKKSCDSSHCQISTFLIFLKVYKPLMESGAFGPEARENVKDFI